MLEREPADIKSNGMSLVEWLHMVLVQRDIRDDDLQLLTVAADDRRGAVGEALSGVPRQSARPHLRIPAQLRHQSTLPRMHHVARHGRDVLWAMKTYTATAISLSLYM